MTPADGADDFSLVPYRGVSARLLLEVPASGKRKSAGAVRARPGRLQGTGSFGSFPLGRFSCTGRSIDQTVRLPPMTYYFDIRETCTQGRGVVRW
jgi:hypothetical protein